VTDEKDWFGDVIIASFDADQAIEEMSEEELAEVKAFREKIKSDEEEARELIREARKDLKKKLDNEILPSGITFEWENEV